ncbi:ABC transporter ATP-binding protein [Sphingobacterium spiritivorum]|uniref:ABC transporter, ATP-binding protein n=1 Tax=Sphingobacterium spiritivorum ATCC 33861 TaxID=525373 RepID=D7VKA7_SPHSI|nr:ABC transporter ATP-binding protein [Sphingobacterium spiritivorum]EFK58709.1 ABC transporter, ATP-binding protein [Sphingobacterium spiritivorum ATCC 33861]QQT34399.1 ABC transporter ATP-binding protein [Sphingobacterium spiritivorum]WQD35246.1 ABC transporter ATP-binding protein [Sphingobacterium spiritivorum]SUI99786.1 Putative multidrug export ATP-binding/permease protein SAV1866 [Sphingobacterium spiritivorum]
MKTYFRLLSFAKPIEKYAIPYIICTLVTVIFSTLNLALLAPLLHTLFNTEGEVKAALVEPDGMFDILGYFNYYANWANQEYGPYEALKIVCIVIVISVLISNAFRYFSQRIMENLRIHTLLNLRKAVFGNVMDLHLGYFSGQRKGDVISKIASDVQVVQFSVTGTLQVVFKEPLQLIAYLVMLFVISAKLTLFSMLVIPVSAFFISRIVKTLKAQAQEGQQSYANMITYLDEALSGVRIIKAFNATDFVKNRFNHENHRYANIMRRMVRRQQMGSPVSELLGVVMVAVILLYGGSLVLSGSGDLPAADFIAYIAIFSQIMRPAKAITDSFSNIHNGVAAGERVLELIDERSEVVDKADAVVVDNFNSDIRFEHVDFAYGEHKVLSDINLTIEKGKTIALVGPSGGGKSTLVDLIPRFMDVTGGKVLFDGKDLRDLNQESLRRLIGVVNQDSILFNDTIFNNIAFANESASQEQVEAAAKIANAHQFILNTEEGYQTNIGDRGAKLSGGQRQRLCIARAVLKNPPIMLLDEATSALDTESEKLVQEALYKLMENRTTVVIAHRLSTIQNADKIVVVEGGKIVEYGTHSELLVRQGLYKRLIDMQQFGE